MSFPRYPAYKDSGVSWIGRVPAHWVKRSLSDTSTTEAYSFVDGPFGSDLKNDEYVDKGVPLIQLNNIGVGVHNTSSLKFITEEKAESLARHRALAGDLVIAKMAEPVARAAVVANQFPRYTIVADCIKLSLNTVLWHTQYLQYWMNSQAVRSIAETYSAGITRLRINLGAVRKLPVFDLPISEQHSIAAFLDRETAKIDELVAEQENLIGLLKEKRQAVISHAVTKGLDPSVPMKDSGVKWLGEVPAHWEVRQVRSIASFLTSGPRGWSERVGEEGSLFVQSGDLTDDLGIVFSQAKRVAVENDAEASRTRLAVGDVVVCITGAKTGNVAVCAAVEEDAYINQHLCLIRPTADVLPWFLGVFLKSDAGQRYFGIAQYGLKQGLSLENVKATPLVVPPVAEQEALVEAVTHASEQMDHLIGEAVLSIELLRERRTALISAAVTGQIDVRASVYREASA